MCNRTPHDLHKALRSCTADPFKPGCSVGRQLAALAPRPVFTQHHPDSPNMHGVLQEHGMQTMAPVTAGPAGLCEASLASWASERWAHLCMSQVLRRGRDGMLAARPARLRSLKPLAVSSLDSVTAGGLSLALLLGRSSAARSDGTCRPTHPPPPPPCVAASLPFTPSGSGRLLQGETPTRWDAPAAKNERLSTLTTGLSLPQSHTSRSKEVFRL